MHRLVSLWILVSVVSFLGSPVSAGLAAAGKAEWPHWRGPNRDAVSTETGLLKEWPADGPPLAWRAEKLGNGYSTVAIVGGKIYTMGGSGSMGQAVIALDRATGKRLWAAKVSSSGGKTQSTPVFNDGLVYALSTDAELACFDAATGRDVWRKNLQRDLGGGRTPTWKFAESPYIDGDRLICTPGGEDSLLAALEKKTGKVIWQCALPDSLRGRGAHAQYATVTATEAGGVRQYVTLIKNLGLVGVAAKDGRFLWNYRRINNGTANIATAVAQGEYVFCSTAYNTGAALLKLSGAGAEEAYFLGGRTFQNHHGGFLRIGEHIYGGHGHGAGNPTCIEMRTGKVLWQQSQPGGGSGAVVAADGHLYFLYQKGQVALIEARPDGYKLKGLFELPRQGGPAWAHPVVCGGKLYLRWADKLFCYDVKAK
jgi:outer membrane protein assembly factor BamB